MKNRLVIWATDEKDQKLLLLYELLVEDDVARLYMLPHSEVPEKLFQGFMNKWRVGQEYEIPESATVEDIPLELGEEILPENFKTVEKGLLQRTKAEWQFYAASHKMYCLYKEEVEELKEKVEETEEFSGQLWEDLKTYWSKVQRQIDDKNILGNHIGELRKKTDSLFDKLKELRKEKWESQKEKSQPIYENYLGKIVELEEKIEKGLSLRPIFDELKKTQNNFNKEDLHWKHKKKLWKKIDPLFKTVKFKLFGEKKEGNNKLAKLKRRLSGLENVIKKISGSLKHEEKNYYYEEKRMNNSGNEMEMKLRKAKLLMIEEKINSKKAKLEDIRKTKQSILSKIEFEEKKKKKEEEKKAFEKAKQKAKKKIKKQIALKTKEDEKTLKGKSKGETENPDLNLGSFGLNAIAISKILEEE